MIPTEVREHLDDDVGEDPVYVLAHLYCLQKHAVDLWVIKNSDSESPFFKPSAKQAKAINEILFDIRVEYSKLKPEFSFLPKFVHEVRKDGTARIGIATEYHDLLKEAMDAITEKGGPSFGSEVH
jgi:hypothetical protein